MNLGVQTTLGVGVRTRRGGILHGMAGKLNLRQAAFVREYLIDLNATAAAGRAGYKHPNVQGPRLLVNVGVAQALEAAQAKASAKAGLTHQYVINGLKREAENHDEGSSASARVRALELLGKHLGMKFTDTAKHEHEGIIEVRIVADDDYYKNAARLDAPEAYFLAGESL
jgi:hypothetical protein